MLELLLYMIIFIMGIYFGSFFTLATYRIPKGENITYKHSYCPNCHHRLGIFELIPLVSYLFLGGKCKYCQQKISIRYFLIEFLSGLTFVLFAISLSIEIPSIQIHTIVYFLLGILYLSSLFIISGIDKEQHIIPKSVIMFGIIIAIAYMIYAYTLNPNNVYAYIIYLIMMVVLLLADTTILRKKLKYNYTIQILILILYMLIFSGTYLTLLTVLISILAIGFRNILLQIRKKDKDKFQTPFAFFLCVANIVSIIITNYVINYLIQ